MAIYAAYRKAHSKQTATPKPTPKIRAAKVIAHASQRGRLSLLEPEAYELCNEYGIIVPPYRVVESVESAIAAANEIKYPVALKVVSEEILNKIDACGVLLGIDSDSALKGLYAQLVAKVKKAAPNLSTMRVLAQKMIPSNTELVLWGRPETQFLWPHWHVRNGPDLCGSAEDGRFPSCADFP